MKLLFAASTALLLALTTARAQMSLTSNTYTQDFDALPAAGGISTLPAGWAFIETGFAANAAFSEGNGSSRSGDTFNYGSVSSVDRALGTLRTRKLISTFGAGFINNTGSMITQLSLSYMGEEWRLGKSGRTDQLNFEYSTDATSLTTGTWINFNSLDFVTPNTTGRGAHDGNAAANQTALSATIMNLTLSTGSTIWIRWTDPNVRRADDGLAIDNFSLTAATAEVQAVPEPATWMLMGAGLLFGTQLFRRKWK